MKSQNMKFAAINKSSEKISQTKQNNNKKPAHLTENTLPEEQIKNQIRLCDKNHE
jgi:hypothetical protein